jgi:hypothetical protein
MPERRYEGAALRKLASAALAFLGWLEGGAAPAGTGGQAREAQRRLRALLRPGPPSGATCTYDSLGRLTQMTAPPAPAGCSLRLGDAGEVTVATGSDVFVFALDARGGLHFVARRPLGPGASEGDRPS